MEEIRERRDFIGVDWVSEDDEVEDGSKEEGAQKKSVRLLDYACGTGVGKSSLAVLAPCSLSPFSLTHYLPTSKLSWR